MLQPGDERPGVGRNELVHNVEVGIPERLAVGLGTAFLVAGSCHPKRGRLRRLEVEVAGRRTAAVHRRLPRLDAYDQAIKEAGVFGESPDAKPAGAFRSGFWALAEVDPPEEPGPAEVSLVGTLRGGAELKAAIGTVILEPQLTSELDRVPTWPGEPGPRVAICMATYNPPPELLRRQVESLRAQTHRNWICLISDDRSRPELFEQLLETIGGDPRFVVSRGDRRLGFYYNFERALAMVPASAEFVSLCDQDDEWDPDKLKTLLAAASGEGVELAYSDARVVDTKGELQHQSYWSTGRHNNHENLASLLYANTITGAASVFPRRLLDRALPFPPRIGNPFHDHWLGLVALASGRIAYVDRATYSYVQHEEAALGHAEANQGLQLARRSLRNRLVGVAVGSRLVYYWGWGQIAMLGCVLRLRSGEKIDARKRRALRRATSVDTRGLSLAWMLARTARKLWGRNETLDAERFLAKGLLWRRAISLLVAGRRRPPRWLTHDTSVPYRPLKEDFMIRMRTNVSPAELIERMIEPLELEVSAEEPERLNLLVPTFDLKHLFGGYITKFNLARKLAEAGVRTRLVTVDPTRLLPNDWRTKIRSYSGLEDLFDKVEIAFARDRDAPLRVNPGDRLIATTWWTAHIANDVLQQLERERFLYLVQEYEALTFPMGSYAALARGSYDYPHVALFSTEFLRSYFRNHRIGVYAEGPERGDRLSCSFQNAITSIERPSPADLNGRDSKALLFYARPEPHAMRNMFELGVLVLTRAIREGVLGPEWRIHGIGSVEEFKDLDLGGGRQLRLLRRTAQDRYGDLLRRHDVGLSLMFTPHPSLPPMEMAAAGMLAVTNTFENKTRESLSSISPNIIPTYPGPDELVEGIRQAVARVPDVEARCRGAAVDWPSDWEAALNPEVMGRVTELLDEL